MSGDVFAHPKESLVPIYPRADRVGGRRGAGLRMWRSGPGACGRRPSTDRAAESWGLIGADIDQCAQTGFNAIEIGNLDTAHRFDPAGSRALARDYVERAHGLGLAIEYPDALAEAGLDADDVCANDQRPPSTIIRDRDLLAPGEPGHVYRACD